MLWTMLVHNNIRVTYMTAHKLICQYLPGDKISKFEK